MIICLTTQRVHPDHDDEEEEHAAGADDVFRMMVIMLILMMTMMMITMMLMMKKMMMMLMNFVNWIEQTCRTIGGKNQRACKPNHFTYSESGIYFNFFF